MPKAPSKQVAPGHYRTTPYGNQAQPPSRPSVAAPVRRKAVMASPGTAVGMAGLPTSYMHGNVQSSLNERSSAAWSDGDDQRLTECRQKGQNWSVIADQFPGKTPNACRKRHERLMEKRNASHLDGVRLADLATAYVECREHMWKMVAERVGEKWQTIEQKCMEKGIKTLTTNARAHRRSHPHGSSHDSMEVPSSRGADMEVSYASSSGFDDMYMNTGKVQNPSYYFNAPPEDMSAFYPHQPAPSQPHSRRASAAHSAGHSVEAHSRASSHGPNMQPPQATNPFASPNLSNMSTQYYGTGHQTLAMAPTLSSQHFPTTSSAAAIAATATLAAGVQHHQQHHHVAAASNGLPSFSSAFNAPRLPSIMSSQG